MTVNHKHHILYYAVLLIILVLGVGLAIHTSYNRSLQLTVIIITTFFYVIGGIIHHVLHHDLNSKIVIEYVLMGAMGISIILFLLRGSI